LNKLPAIDTERLTTQQHYKDEVEWINENVAGESFKDKSLAITRFYFKNYLVPNWLAAGSEISELADKLGEKILEVLKDGKNGKV